MSNEKMGLVASVDAKLDAIGDKLKKKEWKVPTDLLADSAADRDQEEGTGQRASLSQPADVRDDRLFNHPDRAAGHQAGAQAGGQADDR